MIPLRPLLRGIALGIVLGAVPMLGVAPASAAEPTYPPGSRVGLVPPEGTVVSKNFFGFEDAESNVAIVLVTLPPEAYADLERTVSADALKRQGLTLEGREAVTLPSGKAFLVIGRAEVEKVKLRKWVLIASAPGATALATVQVPETARAKYPDQAIRAALASVAVRSTVPAEEQLGLLPFKVGELAGFHVGGVVPGRAVMLSDAAVGTPGLPGAGTDSHMFVAVAPGGPAQATEREAFARDVFGTIPSIKEVHVTSAEPMRVGGLQGHQVLAEAKDAPSGTPITVVQWLRFGGGGYMQMVGVARTEAWKDAYPRFRSVRDGIDSK